VLDEVVSEVDELLDCDEVGEVVVEELRVVVEELGEVVVEELRVVVEELGEVVVEVLRVVVVEVLRVVVEELGEVVVEVLRVVVVEELRVVVEELREEVVEELLVVVEDVDVLEELVVEEDVVLVVVAHAVCALMTSLSKVIPAVRANSPPSFLAPVPTVIEARATIFPANTVPTPRVAELPTCQNTLHAWASLIKDTSAMVEVMSVDPIWKTQTLLGSPLPSRVKVPVRNAEELKW
jgi:hypothetical protein